MGSCHPPWLKTCNGIPSSTVKSQLLTSAAKLWPGLCLSLQNLPTIPLYHFLSCQGRLCTCCPLPWTVPPEILAWLAPLTPVSTQMSLHQRGLPDLPVKNSTLWPLPCFVSLHKHLSLTTVLSPISYLCIFVSATRMSGT